ASDLLSNARRNADRVLGDARAFAERTLSEAVEEAERERAAVQRQVDDLNRQRESITVYLEELRGLLGATPLPSLDAVMGAPAPIRPDSAGPAAELAEPYAPPPAPPAPPDYFRPGLQFTTQDLEAQGLEIPAPARAQEPAELELDLGLDTPPAQPSPPELAIPAWHAYPDNPEQA
ncbi:MAG: hypothetical protein LBT54_05790, partial [Bifidobacteriaceae bacterium]|nr:hypothetical protein [Bifidobacteriaceae bacterium]